MKLTAWIPELAKEVKGKAYSPNWDMIVHLDAQKVARQQGIAWGLEMPADDVEAVKSGVRAKYRK